jgi:hypothetical protein
VMKLPSNDGGKMAATCYDSKLAEIFNRGLASYSHNMGNWPTTCSTRSEWPVAAHGLSMPR